MVNHKKCRVRVGVVSYCMCEIWALDVDQGLMTRAAMLPGQTLQRKSY